MGSLLKKIQLKPIKARLIYCRGIFRISKHLFDSAISDFNKCLDVSGGSKFLHYECYKYLGIAYYYKKEYEKAESCLKEAYNSVEEQKKDAELFTFLGFIQEVHNNYKEALEQYYKAQKVLKRVEIFTNSSLLNERIKICRETEGNKT